MAESDLAELMARIRSGPTGPQIGAFFDMDGTLVAGYTATAFYTDRLQNAEVGVVELARTTGLAMDSRLGGDTARLGDFAATCLQGQAEEDLAEVGERLFAQKTGRTVRPQARELLRAHRKMGHTVAIASSATSFQVRPLARDLGVRHVLCSELEVEDGLLTGRFVDGMLWGEAKARAVRKFARARSLDLTLSYAYGNGSEDAAFLASVGNPHPVNPDSGLTRIAARQGWSPLRLDDPVRRGLRAAVSTVAAVVGMNIGLGIGLGIGRLRQDERLGADLAVALGMQTYLALAGVKLDVIGRHNLWARRPCVFAFNHQSALDGFILGALLEGSVSALGKKELQYVPPLYLMNYALDTVFIDRSDPAAGRVGQERLVERLRGGLSVMIAPEGTRQPTPVLGPFRTGAFHVAIDAGVPIVPVVLRNAYDLQPGSALTNSPGHVQVAVLDPIATDTWEKDTIRFHATEVRARFVDTLENWPEETDDRH